MSELEMRIKRTQDAEQFANDVAEWSQTQFEDVIRVSHFREFMRQRDAGSVPDNMREKLFSGWQGCSNHGCIVTGQKKGMGTNGMCKCLVEASRTQLQMLQGRLSALLTASKEGV